MLGQSEACTELTGTYHHLVNHISLPLGVTPLNPSSRSYTSDPRRNVFSTRPRSFSPSYGDSLFLKFKVAFVTWNGVVDTSVGNTATILPRTLRRDPTR